MRKLASLFLLLLGPALAPGSDTKPTPIRIFVEKPASMRLVEYAPPLLFDYGQLRDGLPVPDWYYAYHAYRRINEFDYEEWIKHFTPQALKALPIETEEAFLAHKKQYNPETFSIKEASALYAVYVSMGKRELCFVVFCQGMHLLAPPADMKELKSAPATLLFEKIESAWKIQDISEADWAFGMRPSERGKIKAIINSQEAYVRPDRIVHAEK